MTEYDLNKVDKAEDKLSKVVTLLQVKYGYTREQAKKELGIRLAAHAIALENGLKPAA